MQRTREELRGISADLLRELQMHFLMANRLRRHQNGDLGLTEDIEMACIESFAIHARLPEAFVWDSPGKAHPDDALVIDFFEDGEWESIRERVQRSALDDLRARAGHEVAHLSYKRVNKPEAARRWKFDVIAGVIGNAFRLFLENVAAEFLCDDFEERLRATWPHYLNFPIAMSFPPDCDTTGDHGRLTNPAGHQPYSRGDIRGNAPEGSAVAHPARLAAASWGVPAIGKSTWDDSQGRQKTASECCTKTTRRRQELHLASISCCSTATLASSRPS